MASKSTLDRWRARAERMRQLQADGWSLSKIAAHYGISRQRAHQIVMKQYQPRERHG